MTTEPNSLSGRRVVARLAAAAWVLCVAVAVASPATAQVPSTTVPPDIARLLDAAPLPPLTLDPTRRHGLLVLERKLLPLDRLAAPTIDLAGRRINPLTASAHAPLDYYGLSIVSIATGEHTRIPLPADSIVGYPLWSPDGKRFAFTLTRGRGTELWIGDPAGARARKLVDHLHAGQGAPCSWAPNSRRMLCRLVPVSGRLSDDSVRAHLTGAAQQTALGEPIVLTDSLVRRLLESQLELIDVESGQRRAIGQPAAFESVRIAPSGAFLLVSRIARPYPRISGVDDAEHRLEIWDRFGRRLRSLPDGARASGWHAGAPGTVVWVMRRDDTDRVMSLHAPFAGDPIERFELPHRFSGLRWLGDSKAALVSDFDASRGRTEHWRVDFESGEAERLLGHRSNAPRWPLMATNAYGIEAVAVNDGHFYLRGERSGPRGRRAALERVSLATGALETVWMARPDGHESLVDIVTEDGGVLLTKHETAEVPPNYFVTRASGERVRTLTRFEHPAPSLTEARHVRLDYERADGLELAASLYLPPGYRDGARLPMIVWAYPRQVGIGGTTRMSAEQPRFPTFERAFRLFFLLQGFAVLDGVSMPIVGSAKSANDTFIEQIVANAEAAISAAAATGHVDPARVGVAGHSYGAFMVANLLAHSNLFRAGAALSGAYNRTLTPFGFQTERRTLWEAPETYLAMSPLLYSHRIAAPLLLVHGLKDDNAGTSPLQSTQFYQAIRGNGGDAELLLLPWEGHSYRARESVLKTASHMLSWFERHLAAPPPQLFSAQKETGASLRPSE